jgi:hypothetical protein
MNGAIINSDTFLCGVQRLKDTESDRMLTQVNAYFDNVIDVQLLLEDSDAKKAAMERLAIAQLDLVHVRILNHHHHQHRRFMFLTAFVRC